MPHHKTSRNTLRSTREAQRRKVLPSWKCVPTGNYHRGKSKESCILRIDISTVQHYNLHKIHIR
jgi:hypothetical protein